LVLKTVGDRAKGATVLGGTAQGARNCALKKRERQNVRGASAKVQAAQSLGLLGQRLSVIRLRLRNPLGIEAALQVEKNRVAAQKLIDPLTTKVSVLAPNLIERMVVRGCRAARGIVDS
jgi:hypothetical protein